MNPGVAIPLIVFTSLTACVIGWPLARAFATRLNQTAPSPRVSHDVTDRLERIEHAVEAMAIEVERISEGQRFVTRVLASPGSERDAAGQRGEG
jgi:hypothetical protein